MEVLLGGLTKLIAYIITATTIVFFTGCGGMPKGGGGGGGGGGGKPKNGKKATRDSERVFDPTTGEDITDRIRDGQISGLQLDAEGVPKSGLPGEVARPNLGPAPRLPVQPETNPETTVPTTDGSGDAPPDTPKVDPQTPSRDLRKPAAETKPETQNHSGAAGEKKRPEAKPESPEFDGSDAPS